MSAGPQPGPRGSVLGLATLAAAAPSLLAYNVSPSPTFLNQALAFAGWGAFAAVLAWRGAGQPRGAGALAAVLALVAAAAAWSWLGGALPSTLGLSALGTLGAAAVLLAVGAAQARRADAVEVAVAFFAGWVVAGLLNATVALAQVYAPGLADGNWIAASGLPGRAVGNLRQPNHLASLLLWAGVGAVALAELGRLSPRLVAAVYAVLVYAVVLSASRTGLVGVLLLAGWGLADRRLSRPSRRLLVAGPLVYLGGWALTAEWAQQMHHAFGGTERLAETDLSSSRFAIWRDTLVLIARAPWAGVGFGEFNFAWTLTPFPDRPVAFFDHSHDLPLQFAVELGLPLAALLLLLLVLALVQGFRRAWRAGGGPGAAARAAMLFVATIGLHSLLEYPLWYAYFLLPAAWAWGFALGLPAVAGEGGEGAAAAGVTAARRRGAQALLAAALLLVAGSVGAVADYLQVTAIFRPGDGKPLDARIAAGRRSIFFGHHADYAAVTSGDALPAPAAFARTAHYLLDTRLMIAWARAYAEAGDLDRARYLAARLREFRNPAADEFFAPCQQPDAAATLPFQCEAPSGTLGWRDFLRP